MDKPGTTKIELDPVASALVSASDQAGKRIDAEAKLYLAKIQRRMKRRSERYDREKKAASAQLFNALEHVLGCPVPQGAAAWVRPDGVGEIVIPGPDPRPKKPETLIHEHAHVAADAAPEDGKILPMPVAATNGAEK